MNAMMTVSGAVERLELERYWADHEQQEVELCGDAYRGEGQGRRRRRSSSNNNRELYSNMDIIVMEDITDIRKHGREVNKI